MRRLLFCYPLPSDYVGISYIALSLYREMAKAGAEVTFMTPRRGKAARDIPVVEALPFGLKWLPWKYVRRFARGCMERQLLARTDEKSIVYLWSTNPLSLYAKLKHKGSTVIKEKFNCAQKVAQEILAREYCRIGLKAPDSLSEQSILQEAGELSMADWIVCASPKVRESLIAIGIRSDKVIASSYGWDPKAAESELASVKGLDACPRPRFLFVGTVCVRKGAHLLIDYWNQAKIAGSLIFLGGVQAELQNLVNAQRGNTSLMFLGHQEKAFDAYSKCDIFAFPSLEEGGPLVTYEAMARGLPVIVSPMGAGAVAVDQESGFVIDPHDQRKWIERMADLGRDATLRVRFKQSALARSKQYTWDKVAQARYALILERANGPAGVAPRCATVV